MRLPFLGNFGKKEVKNYFLALLLQDEKIGAVILEETNGQIHVVSQADSRFSSSLDKASFEELLETTDKAVSLAESSVFEDLQTEKTVFGVKLDWIEDGKIKKEHLLKLKKVCEELALEPIGFLVFTEAIIHLLQQEEGAPVSAILIEVGKKFFTLSLIRAGRIVQTHQVQAEEKIADAIDNALKHFDTEILPARIILYDNEQDEKLAQSFIRHSWSKSLPFIHVPQITVLQTDFDIKGVLYGTASQMGFDVTGEHVIPTKAKAVVKEELSKKEPVEEDKKEIEDETIEEAVQESVADAKDSELKEEDFEEEMEKDEKESSEEETPETFNEEPLETVDRDYFGFVENKDVGNVSHKNLPKYQKAQATEEVFEEIPEEVKEEETSFEKPAGQLPLQASLITEGMQKVFSSISTSLPGVLHVITKTFSKIPRIIKKEEKVMENKSPFPIKVVGVVVVIFAILLGVILFYMFGISANVTITVKPKVMQQATPISFVIDGQNDFDKSQIAVKTISQDEDGTLSQDTTGTKVVGTSAKGSVTIFSRLTESTTISKGTTLTASNDLQFTFNDDVAVASFSGDTTDPSVTVANISVTAKNFGPEYNFPSGTKFTINGLSKSDISAKNDNPFSGGTKKDVRVVSKDDVDKLIASVTKNLESNAKDDLNKKIGQDSTLLPFFSKEEVSQKTLSKNTGDEAKTLSITATVSYTGVVVAKDDLSAFAQKNIQSNSETEKNFTSSKLETTVSGVKQGDNSASGKLTISAILLPKIDSQKITNDISGKSFDVAGSVIKNIPQVQEVEIQLSPQLPFLPKILPKIGSSIHIHVITNNE